MGRTAAKRKHNSRDVRPQGTIFLRDNFYKRIIGFVMIIDIIGWVGSALVVLAYALNMYKKLAADTLAYYLLNITGSVCLIANTMYHRAIPSTAVNVVWVLLALVAMFKKKAA